jgi:hypothetical protein
VEVGYGHTRMKINDKLIEIYTFIMGRPTLS